MAQIPSSTTASIPEVIISIDIDGNFAGQLPKKRLFRRIPKSKDVVDSGALRWDIEKLSDDAFRLLTDWFHNDQNKIKEPEVGGHIEPYQELSSFVGRWEIRGLRAWFQDFRKNLSSNRAVITEMKQSALDLLFFLNNKKPESSWLSLGRWDQHAVCDCINRIGDGVKKRPVLKFNDITEKKWSCARTWTARRYRNLVWSVLMDRIREDILELLEEIHILLSDGTRRL